MKKMIFSLFFISLLTSACDKDDDIVTRTPPKDNNISTKIVPGTYDQVPETITLKIHNNSEEAIYFGTDYEVDKLKNGKWVRIPFRDRCYFTDLGCGALPGETFEQKIGFNCLKKGLDRGTYRIVKKINRQEYLAEFEIK